MKSITLIIYAILTFSWLYILIFSTKELIKNKLNSKSLFVILFTILVIDSLRTIIESAYFGTRLASQYGVFPKEIFVFLSNPEYLFIPKFINALAALSIIFLIFKKWYPQELKENELLKQKYEKEKQDKQRLKALNENLDSLVNEKTIELKKLNENLKQKVQEEVEKNKEQEHKVFIQSKMASMGEMLGNIAHQWRQPLSTISTLSSGTKMQIYFNTIKQEDINKNLDQITSNVQHLSQTIDDFQNFFKPNKEAIEFNCNELIDKSLKLNEASLKSNNIKVNIISKNICTLKGYENEYIQTIMNILNNAKDALCQKEQEHKQIDIEMKCENNTCIIEISDNGGGIDENIIERIFEPYFTTKHQSHGTGIGLYMSKEIIEKHMHGKIEAKNIQKQIDGHTYKGACFYISLKLSSCKKCC